MAPGALSLSRCRVWSLGHKATSIGQRFTGSTCDSPHVVVAGCGIAGASTAMHLARRGARVTLVDPRPPLTATSQYSTECYRDFFMDRELVPFISRSLDIMEDLAGEQNVLQMSRRGYCFLSGTLDGRNALEKFAETAAAFGAGDVRSHSQSLQGYRRGPSHGFRAEGLSGMDLIYGADLIREVFPFVTEEAQVMLHARRCGWLDAQGFGQAVLQDAKANHASVLQGRVTGCDTQGGQIVRVHVLQTNDTEVALDCDAFVNAAGAWMQAVNGMISASPDLPLSNELHAKVILHDKLGVIPQAASPFMVWRDKVVLEWDEETREGLKELDDSQLGGIVNSRRWLEPQPGGQHLRPAGNGRVLLLWEHLHRHIELPPEPSMPVDDSLLLDMYPQLCVAGLTAMVPGLAVYKDSLTKETVIDGGYYTVTPDARPLIGPWGAGNAFVCGGMGTYGLMGAAAAGELAALHVLGEPLPEYAEACCWPRLRPIAGKPIDLLDDSA